MTAQIVLEARNISKHFPGVMANDHVNFNLRRGEIHALLGENGAGKSTLMNIIYGLYSQDEGEIWLSDGNGGEPQLTHIQSPLDAIQLGIGMVHQHFMLVPVFTVTENIILGDEITRGLSLDKNTAQERIRQLSQDHGLEVDPEAIIEEISVGAQQRVEILKALYRQAQILVLDEPTAVLTPQEVDDMFLIIRQLTAKGVSVIFITHKLKEVLAIADRITVMRRGQVVGTTTPAETNERGLAEMMVGRAVLLSVEKEPATPGEVVLEVDGLRVCDVRGLESVKQVSFQVRAGEILGIAGVQGNGQTELVEALTGLRSIQEGRVKLGENVFSLKENSLNTRQLVELGVSHIPEDRQKHGLVLQYTIADNEVLNSYYRKPFARGIRRARQPVMEYTDRLILDYDIRTPSPLVTVGSLSGGNQQKVIVARELSRPVKLLIANQPTRGLDVGSIEYIHSQIVQMRDKGAAVLLISAELDEIMSLSDRIAILYHGQIVSVIDATETTREECGLLMAGAKLQ